MKRYTKILILAVMTAVLGACQNKTSPEVISDAKSICQAIDRSNGMLEMESDNNIHKLEQERENQPEKAEKMFSLAKEVNSKTEELDNYIEGLMKELNKSDNDGDPGPVNSLLADGKDGALLLTKLDSYKADVKSIMSEYPLPVAIPVHGTPESPILTNDVQKENQSWQKEHFNNLPKAVAITLLNKFKNDALATKALCFKRLLKEAVSIDIVLDEFEPLISAQSDYIPIGGVYEATIGLAAFSTSTAFEVYVDGKQLPVKNGKATYRVTSSQPGTFTVPLLVKIPKKRGGYEESHTVLTYTVSAK